MAQEDNRTASDAKLIKSVKSNAATKLFVATFFLFAFGAIFFFFSESIGRWIKELDIPLLLFTADLVTKAGRYFGIFLGVFGVLTLYMGIDKIGKLPKPPKKPEHTCRLFYENLIREDIEDEAMNSYSYLTEEARKEYDGYNTFLTKWKLQNAVALVRDGKYKYKGLDVINTIDQGPERIYSLRLKIQKDGEVKEYRCTAHLLPRDGRWYITPPVDSLLPERETTEH
jgi:hypothetical protein